MPLWIDLICGLSRIRCYKIDDKNVGIELNNNIGVYWFTNDLRIHDNPLLQRASVEVDALICVYCYPELSPFLRQYAQEAKLGYSRQLFLNQSLDNLNESLSRLSQGLIVLAMPLHKAITLLQQQVKLTHLYVDEQAGGMNYDSLI
ncbi:deoxyribodipyrimidine photo-lyase [Shewanella aestuarii]|uniref:deoxyribodipyrimidine photo-lyase n=1 Tax=Shewanella aestuarii TaxID=1028752 RepID=UPI001FCAAE8F|nr:deoxyribodipyrimidine photo-lyase [Shewanella aestuarii]